MYEIAQVITVPKKETAKLPTSTAVSINVSSSTESEVANVKNAMRKKGATKYFAIKSSKLAGMVDSVTALCRICTQPFFFPL